MSNKNKLSLLIGFVFLLTYILPNEGYACKGITEKEVKKILPQTKNSTFHTVKNMDEFENAFIDIMKDYKGLSVIILNRNEKDKETILKIIDSGLKIPFDNNELEYYTMIPPISLYYMEIDKGSLVVMINIKKGMWSKDKLERINQYVDEVIERHNIDKLPNDKRKAEVVNEFIRQNYRYGKGRTGDFFLEGFIITKQGMCQAYSTLFQTFMNRLDIDSRIVKGYVNYSDKKEDHAWNMVKVNNKWFHVDVTANSTNIPSDINKFLFVPASFIEEEGYVISRKGAYPIADTVMKKSEKDTQIKNNILEDIKFEFISDLGERKIKK